MPILRHEKPQKPHLRWKTRFKNGKRYPQIFGRKWVFKCDFKAKIVVKWLHKHSNISADSFDDYFKQFIAMNFQFDENIVDDDEL